MTPPMTPNDPFEPGAVIPPECRSTVELLNGVLDRELPAGALDADPHVTACTACRERVATARLLVSILAAPSEPATASPGLTDRILDAVRADRAVVRTQQRRRVLAVAGSLAVAAAVILAVWLRTPPQPPGGGGERPPAPEIAAVAPLPHDAPAPRVPRIGDEFSKAGQALRDAPRPISGSVTAAPQLFAKVSDMLTWTPPVAGADRASVLSDISEIPEVARTGLEPVTGTAQKAFSRLMRDVGGVSLVAKPKS